MNVRIRPVKETDCSAIEALLSQITQVHYAIRPDIFRLEYKKEAECWEENDDAPMYVAVNEQDNVVGCLWCIIMHMRHNSLKIDRDWLCIDDICVDEKYRKQGIGRKLVEFSCKLAKDRGLSRIELNVYNDNLNAVDFYKKFGFKTQKRVMELNL